MSAGRRTEAASPGGESNATTARVDVVVVSFNTRQALADCLRSVSGQPIVGRVVVVDNGSSDGTADMVRADFPAVDLVSLPENPGYGAAANAGFLRTAAPFALLLNADVRATPGSIETLVDFLDRSPLVALVGPRLVDADGHDEVVPRADPSIRELITIESGVRRMSRQVSPAPHVASETVPWVIGAAMAVRRDAFTSVGGFDPSYFLYFEEVDLCRRLRSAGWSIARDSAATMVHLGGASTAQRRVQSERSLYRSLDLFHRTHGTARPQVYRATVLAIMAARIVIGPLLGVRRGARARRSKSTAAQAVFRDAWAGWAPVETHRRLGVDESSRRSAVERRRRIVVVTPFEPVHDAAHGAARAVHGIVSHLVASHDVRVVVRRDRVEPKGARRAGARLRRSWDLIRGIPPWASDWRSSEFVCEIETAVREHRADLVMVDFLALADVVGRADVGGLPVVLTDHDPPMSAALDRLRRSKFASTPWRALEVVAWWRTKRRAARLATVIVVFDDADRMSWERQASSVVVVPFPLELPSVALDPAGHGPPSIVFVGNFMHPPNLAAAQRAISIMPRLWHGWPTLRLMIVGDGAPQELATDERVVLTGYLRDLDTVLDPAWAVVAPVGSGGGQRVKVLEALAKGKAVVGSELAARGLPPEARAQMMIVEDDDALVEAIDDLLHEPSRRTALGRGARSWAEQWLSTSQVAARYEYLFRQVDALAAAPTDEERGMVPDVTRTADRPG